MRPLKNMMDYHEEEMKNRSQRASKSDMELGFINHGDINRPISEYTYDKDGVGAWRDSRLHSDDQPVLYY